MFNDAWNPTQDEIRAWAYTPNASHEQDWELAVNETENIPMICGFINDEKCQHKPFFLSSLYVYTGDIVRSKDEERILRLIKLLNEISDGQNTSPVLDWIIHSIHLVTHPEKYNYAHWGIGSAYVYGKTS
jgi:hypothetical protein